MKMKICACIPRDNLDKNQWKNLTKKNKKRKKKVGGAGRDGLCHVPVEEAYTCLTKEDERKTLNDTRESTP